MKHPMFVSCTASLLATAISACLFPAHAAETPAGMAKFSGIAQTSDVAMQENGTNRAENSGRKTTTPNSTTTSSKNAVNLSGISVSGQLASLQRAQEIKRDASGIVDSVSAEEAGKFPDQNVADALQRVPGVSVDRTAASPIRSPSEDSAPTFVNVLLNGRSMASTATNRAFNFDVLPSSLISTAIVNKTSSADIDEGGIGGTVNIVTARPLDYKGFHASASLAGVYDSLSASPSEK